ncbi:Uma2 family endonuclease [Streptomyces sp. NPDC046237]|uniref:Uma2 family endonuclease n=1 Tax=Streptomyces sp. NPDC046237 TaxID=3154914 RepID=UPI00340F5CCD
MSALTVEHSSHGYGWDGLVRIWQETDAPEGCKVEIIEGIITVSPPPSNNHNDIADEVHRALYPVIPRDWGVYQTLGAAVPSRSGLYIPDLAVVPKAALRSEGGNFVAAAEAELIVEITSQSNASADRITKAAGYAQAGVPLYLLIDGFAPGGPTVTLYGEPKSEVYRVLSAVKFGMEIHLPAPFGLTIDTGTFPV